MGRENIDEGHFRLVAIFASSMAKLSIQPHKQFSSNANIDSGRKTNHYRISNDNATITSFDEDVNQSQQDNL